MGNVSKEILIGFFVSIFATAAGMFLYIEYFSRFGFFETIEMIKAGQILGPVIALSAIPNLFVFFVYLKKKQDLRAKGVLIGTLCIAIFTFILKIF